jgi:hypothetical protein
VGQRPPLDRRAADHHRRAHCPGRQGVHPQAAQARRDGCGGSGRRSRHFRGHGQRDAGRRTSGRSHDGGRNAPPSTSTRRRRRPQGVRGSMADRWLLAVALSRMSGIPDRRCHRNPTAESRRPAESVRGACERRRNPAEAHRPACEPHRSCLPRGPDRDLAYRGARVSPRDEPREANVNGTCGHV